MTEDTWPKQCQSCGTKGQYSVNVTLCPLCGGNLEADGTMTDTYSIELIIPFAGRPCSSCGTISLLRKNRQCVRCGTALNNEEQPNIDGAVKRRRQAFKVLLQRLVKRTQNSAMLQPSFTREGSEVSPAEYIQTIFEPSRNTVLTLTEEVRMELRAVTWDPQKEPACISSFQRIVRALDQGITLVTTLSNQLPPVGLRAAHRILTRTIGQIIHSYITIIETLIAIDPDEMLEQQKKGQQLLTQGTHTLALLPRIITFALKESSPGWWMSGETLNLAAIAWAGVENTPTTINQAAHIVRAMLAPIPGIAELSDADALLLLPATVLPLTIVDPILLQERATLIHRTLADADLADPSWIQDPTELVLRINEGIRAANEQAERLGFEATNRTSRRKQIELLTNVYLKLVEGPLRELGSVIVIAARAAKGEANGKYIPRVARGVKTGETVQLLESMGPWWADAVLMLVRNAEAHAGVRILETGVELTQRRIENGEAEEKIEKLTDARFAEEFARVSETCLALQVAVVSWLFTHKTEGVIQARQTAALAPQERERIVHLLAGLQGLQQVRLQQQGNTVILRAETADNVDASAPLILALVPAILESWADADIVTLQVGSHPPVTYKRAELPGIDPLSGEQDLVAVSLMGRRWLGDLSGDAAIRADITYVVQPQLIAIEKAFIHAGTSPISTDRIAEAEARLVSLKNRLRLTQLPLPSTPLVAEIRDTIHDAARLLNRLRWAFVGSEARERQHQARAFVAFNSRLRDLAQRSNKEFTRVQEDEQRSD